MNLYAFGSNGSGQLALAHTEDVSAPNQCHFETPPHPDDKIVHIVAGGNHTLLLTRRGCVYAAGCNSDGRCGPQPPETSSESTQQKSPSLEQSDNEGGDILPRFRRVILTDPVSGCVIDKFKHVSATWEGSILVASIRRSTCGERPGYEDECEDKIFVLGSTPKGELGLGPEFSSPVRPGTRIPGFPPSGATVTALASGMAHSVAVLSNGDVYGWGAARKGQLGDGLKSEKIVWNPAKIEGIPFPATGAVCGREFTVILGIGEKGQFIVLGDRGNRWGVLDIPSSLCGRRYLNIGASWHGIYLHAAASESEEGDTVSSGAGSGAGSVVAWGRNDRGQLPPSDLPPVAKMAVGSEHVLALLEDGAVAAFGWGEHGNCGPETDPLGNVSGSYTLISLPDSVSANGGKVVGVGAGCATSWLIVE